MTKYVYAFTEGNKDMRNLLGGKGANLAEMTNLGLPIPKGFTITTEACINYYKEREEKLEKARANAKPGSLASKANMVKNFNENK